MRNIVLSVLNGPIRPKPSHLAIFVIVLLVLIFFPGLGRFSEKICSRRKRTCQWLPAWLLLPSPDSTLGQKARDLEVPEVFHKFKPLLLMFLMAKKYGTPRGTKILKICIWNASCPSWDKNLIWTRVSGFLVRGRCILRWIELVWGVQKVCGMRDATIWWWKLSARWKSECFTLQVWKESQYKFPYEFQVNPLQETQFAKAGRAPAGKI